ncbi:MAG: cadmium-translocating P-type ATPase [Deltaproteobacteria bacterium]|nr:cadmium-translocating P-type ATPase [Deltaproteobacteria bacterium]
MTDCQKDACGCGSRPAEIRGARPAPLGDARAASRAVFRIDKMDCPTEEATIRKRLSAVEGVVGLEFNLMTRTLTISHTMPSEAPLVQALKDIDMAPSASADGAETAPEPRAKPIPTHVWWLMGVSGAAALGSELLAWTTGKEKSWPVIVLALLSIGTGGLGTLKKGWVAIRTLSLNMNLLMSVAVIGAAIIGQWPEAAMVIWLFAVAEMIEQLSLDRARNAIRGLMAISPDKATVLQGNGGWKELEAKRVEVGQTARVKPGERVPLDGVVTKGRSAVNQAPITGESVPVEKEPGDQVFAGTINESGSFEFRVTANADQSTLARIMHAVEEAQGSRAPTQRFVDNFARVYTPVVFGVALLVALVPPLAFGQPAFQWVYRALVLLVIGCPCALVISTPVTVVSGLASAARHGILIKGGAYLEAGRKLRALALDKTGTITHGRPVVTDVLPWGGADESEAIRLAGALAVRSDHPVSSAVSTYVREKIPAHPLAEVTEFEALPGRGVKGAIGGQTLHLGNHRLLEELGACSPSIEGALTKLEEDGKTAIILTRGREPVVVVGVADTVRATSREAISDLRLLGVHTVMVTGDNDHTAKAIGRAVGIDDARGNLLPQDKVAAIDMLIGQHGTVGMVGDGINDAPALAKASMGFAMGAAGTDTALETADVALMDDDLRKIPWFIRLSSKMNAVLLQNIVLALGIKAVFLALALAGRATLWMAVFADMGASLLVVVNGLRLLSKTSAAQAAVETPPRSQRPGPGGQGPLNVRVGTGG